ncbi:MAG: HAMP domain-containing histidine kinase [Rhizobacter sp.]|nr:HAMP domain-containing histidine kinase [Bacteriovorax sp.]
MSKLAPYSLARKLTVASVAISASTMILITGIVYLIIVSFGNMFLYNELNEKSEFIKKSFIEPIWTYDQYQINEVGNSLLGNDKYTYISALKIQSADNELLYEKKRDNLKDKDFSAIANLPYSKSRIIKIYKGNQQIGLISLAMTNFGYIEAFRHQFIIVLVTSLLLLFALMQFVRYYFHHTLTIPMNKILAQVKQIENENYDVCEITGLPQELESISHALTQAAIVIEKRNNDIKYYTNDLEELVKERTAELEGQMAKNLNTARLAAIGEMAADVAHEINNPLTVIDLHITKLKRQEPDRNLTQETMNSIDKIQIMIKRIVKIIKGLKSLSRDGESDPFVPFSVSSMIEDVKMLVEMKVNTHDIHFDIKISDPNIYAEGREVQISQVLVNLIGNAVDAVMTYPGEQWINVDIVGKNDIVEFKITDSGNGIPESIKEKVMRPFFTTKGLNKGTGLGLSISKSIIEEHGGDLIYNNVHQNTQFIFTLRQCKECKLTA